MKKQNGKAGSRREKVRAAMERVQEGLENIGTDEEWLKFLAFQGKFHRYSFRNTMLIYSQKPEASFVKGYRAWRDIGRSVRRGSKGIGILCPCIYKGKLDGGVDNDAGDDEDETVSVRGFRMGYVFDVSDTEGDDSVLPVLVSGLSGGGTEEMALYGSLRAFISRTNPVLERPDMTAKGTFDRETGAITVRSLLSPRHKAKTLLHEYGHCVDFRLNPDREIPRPRRELVAESTAYIVSSLLGIDTAEYSFGYLNSWLGDKKELALAADCIQKVADTIINELAESGDPAFNSLKEVP